MPPARRPGPVLARAATLGWDGGLTVLTGSRVSPQHLGSEGCIRRHQQLWGLDRLRVLRLVPGCVRSRVELLLPGRGRSCLSCPALPCPTLLLRLRGQAGRPLAHCKEAADETLRTKASLSSESRCHLELLACGPGLWRRCGRLASPLWVPVSRPRRETGVTSGLVRPIGLGQLLVWEWQSESYVLKQQGHFNSMVSLAYSPDGQYIVTGGDDGKVRWLHPVWVGGPPPVSVLLTG